MVEEALLSNGNVLLLSLRPVDSCRVHRYSDSNQARFEHSVECIAPPSVHSLNERGIRS
jgi:hypothetical protein